MLNNNGKALLPLVDGNLLFIYKFKMEKYLITNGWVLLLPDCMTIGVRQSFKGLWSVELYGVLPYVLVGTRNHAKFRKS